MRGSLLLMMVLPSIRPNLPHGIPYFDVEYTVDGERRFGRISFELYWKTAEKTANNFYQLVLGTTIGDRHYKYENSSFHRIIPGFVMQGGDVLKGDGTGSISVYGGTFADESFKEKHDRQGKLSMANRGKDTNGSQFFITFGPQPHLDGRHVVFGEVHKECLPLIRDISRVMVNSVGTPRYPVRIVKSGVVEPEGKEEL